MCVVLQAACLSSRITFGRYRVMAAIYALVSTLYRRRRMEKVTEFFKKFSKTSEYGQETAKCRFFLENFKKVA